MTSTRATTQAAAAAAEAEDAGDRLLTDREMLAVAVESPPASLRPLLPPEGKPVYVVDPFRRATYLCTDPDTALLPMREMCRLYPDAFKEASYCFSWSVTLAKLAPQTGALTYGPPLPQVEVISFGVDPLAESQPAMRCSLTTGSLLHPGFCMVYRRRAARRAQGRPGRATEFKDLPDDSVITYGTADVYKKFLNDNQDPNTPYVQHSTTHCAVCGKDVGVRRCGECKYAFYCGQECQERDWPQHRKRCTGNMLRRGQLQATEFGKVITHDVKVMINHELARTLAMQNGSEMLAQFIQRRRTQPHTMTLSYMTQEISKETKHSAILPVADETVLL